MMSIATAANKSYPRLIIAIMQIYGLNDGLSSLLRCLKGYIDRAFVQQ